MAETAVANLEKQNQELSDNLAQARDIIFTQQSELSRLQTDPIVYGTIMSDNHNVVPESFEVSDRVYVIDKEHAKYGHTGEIVKGVNMDTGNIRVKFYNEKKTYALNIGLATILEEGEPKKSQVQLLNKNDGTNIVVVAKNETMEVRNSQRFDPSRGWVAKLHCQTRQVLDVMPPMESGDIAIVLDILADQNVEVEYGSARRLIKCGFKDVRKGDRLSIDQSGYVAVRHFPSTEDSCFRAPVIDKMTWDDIGGQNHIRDEIVEAIFTPFQKPELFEYYNVQMPCGFALYGPPGCGKTLLGKIIASQLADIFGTTATKSGFNYVKGPEILSKWVGESESNTRIIFERSRRHFEENGYPCVTFVDECDAIFGERGADPNNKWRDTLVNMWLAEMDGFDRKSNILILATNRMNSLDGALTREGRIDRHFKVNRPNRNSAVDIFGIHIGETPLNKVKREEFCSYAAENLMDTERPLYKVLDKQNKEHAFGFQNCVSGSMIEAIVNESKQIAIRRDMQTKKFTGVRVEDVDFAIDSIYKRHITVNHKYDIEDFAENNKFAVNKVQKVINAF